MTVSRCTVSAEKPSRAEGDVVYDSSSMQPANKPMKKKLPHTRRGSLWNIVL